MAITEKTCKICGHQWFPRSPEKPRVCPKCKNARWDVGRKRRLPEEIQKEAVTP